MIKTMIRQGDVLVVPCKSIPSSVTAAEPIDGRLILALGEATGHHHSIAAGSGVTMFRANEGDGGLYLSISGSPVSLEHQEHTALTIKPGNYEVRIQRTMQSGQARRVAD
jgi:hypothetical protein